MTTIDRTDASAEEFQTSLARFDAAARAPESFVHLSTCEGTDDAPGLCECPPSFLDVGALR